MEIDINEIIDSLSASYKLTNEEVFEVLNRSLVEAWTTFYGDGYEIFTKIKDGKICLMREVTIVEEVENIKTEVKGVDIGTKIEEKLDLKILPRNIIMGIHETISREVKNIHKFREYELYKNQVDKIFKYTVKKIMGRSIIINVANIYEGIIPYNMSNQRERFFPGDSIYCRLAEVKYNPMDYQLIFERRSTDFIALLLEEFIPEIESGLINIVNIARDTGNLSKVLVESSGSVNAIGACFGMKGNRRNEIMRELNGEKIDFINYNSNPIYQIKECFKPKKIDIFRVHILEDGSIEAVIADDKISEAIGKGGMNIFLTKKLIGNGIHILKISEYQEREREKVEKLAENLLEFNIDHDTAITILLKYSNLEDSLFDNSLEDDMKGNIRKYLDSLLAKERRNFIDDGGNESFFMSIPNIPSFVYTQLLQHNIFDKNDLVVFENANNLESITKLDIDICIMIMEYVKESENKE